MLSPRHVFSARGHIAVPNTIFVLGRWPWKIDSQYVFLLAIKIIIALAMVGLALDNRYRSVGKMKVRPAFASRKLVLRTMISIGLGAGAVFLRLFTWTAEPSLRIRSPV